ncbi:hypothetical protein ACFFKE_32045 [Streptomyces mutabilis]|uniref:hypothetical protein n=1 Tax=Streptomyces mutabilis TaxID=67332 RepID=UPI001783BEA5|nr:hypothetical protein [Streptomyces mutabilis]GGQ19836.1 hypothetical protein GCM10010279_29600 [Streptomyces mutabilis]
MSLTGGNRNDVIPLELLLDEVLSVAGRAAPGDALTRCWLTRGYDHDTYRRLLW